MNTIATNLKEPVLSFLYRIAVSVWLQCLKYSAIWGTCPDLIEAKLPDI
jgi:hypothetical protein